MAIRIEAIRLAPLNLSHPEPRKPMSEAQTTPASVLASLPYSRILGKLARTYDIRPLTFKDCEHLDVPIMRSSLRTAKGKPHALAFALVSRRTGLPVLALTVHKRGKTSAAIISSYGNVTSALDPKTKQQLFFTAIRAVEIFAVASSCMQLIVSNVTADYVAHFKEVGFQRVLDEGRMRGSRPLWHWGE